MRDSINGKQGDIERKYFLRHLWIRGLLGSQLHIKIYLEVCLELHKCACEPALSMSSYHCYKNVNG